MNFSLAKTGVEIRFHVKNCDWIPERIRDKLYEQVRISIVSYQLRVLSCGVILYVPISFKNINRINKDGYLIITSEKTRKNLLNQADCIEKIRTMIFEAAKVPKGISKEDLAQIEIR